MAGCDHPRCHNIGLLLDLLNSQGLALPSNADALAALTPFGTVFRDDDLPFEDVPDRHSWPPLFHSGAMASAVVITALPHIQAGAQRLAPQPFAAEVAVLLQQLLLLLQQLTVAPHSNALGQCRQLQVHRRQA